MVQKYQSPVRVYKYPFELLMMAYEMRFPTCDMIPIIKETEIIEENLCPDGAVHMVDRRAKLNVEVPYLLKKFMGVEYLLFRQRNTKDNRARTLRIEAWNESFESRVEINEYCVYSVHPENPDWTCFEQSAELDIKNFFGFEGTAEKIAIREYSKSIEKSKDIMEHFIKMLAEQGISEVPPWTEPEKSINQVPETSQEVQEKAVDPTEKLRRKSSAKGRDLLETGLNENQDPVTKLEQDYIQMFLGKLEPMQESRLVQLKQCMAELQKGKAPSDPVVLRFLRARNFDVEKAREMLSASLIWRKQHGVDKILSEYQVPAVVRNYFPGGWFHYDKDGRPVFHLRLGQMDVKGIVRSIGEEGLTKLCLHICEEGLRLSEESSHALNKPISTWNMILDLEGLNMRHLWRPGVKALLHIIEICEANYPETLGRVLIIRAPRVFPILWTLVCPLIDETSRSKFLFYAVSDGRGENFALHPGGLRDYIPEEHIPDWLGGTANTGIPEGGLVPKSFYMSPQEFEKDQSPGPHLLDNSCYHSISLHKGQAHEVLIQNTDKGSVITWDFDVMRHDVVFSVFRTKNPLLNKKLSSANQPSSAAFNMCVNTDPEQFTSIGRGWKEGTDYFRVEAPIVCHDGESIQGSHVTQYVGSYILHWSYFDKIVAGNQDMWDTITHPQHKAKVMFYYEVLNSLDYKGSMTSLQSSQSGFSTISKASNQHSTSGVSSCISGNLSETTTRNGEQES
ncbi:SEC14-like protein 1 [Eurytemora carolleeae]|uniref:SEC14-like protein 1 n=1 Tax=Eurytemora carolleeae TaxID=1294199 RepID=UPI000C790E1F|nr:SEC14-like protein 1 [Eurytemora carolleeae]XP_023332666.1 SEC14-like protein 1 [Eurytemora carolleeae]|eukprot:XP_023332657.1 SEC14-like protein 1 [Eurytemora affinis]